MTKLKGVIACVALCVTLVKPACTPNNSNNSNSAQPQASKKVVMIWCDVTSSLQQSEVGEVAKLASDILDSLPEGTRYILYPIQRETERLKEITSGEVPPSDPDIDDLVKKERRKLISNEINKLFEDVNKKKTQPENRTCILNTLAYTESYFRQFASYKPELIFISDMTEQCSTTPMGKPIDLRAGLTTQKRISQTLQSAQEFPSPPDLSHIRLTIIIPTTADTYAVPPGQRPSVDNLKKFWGAIFRNCKVPDEVLNDSYWLSGVPDRFRANGA